MKSTFNDALEAVERLDPDDQANLIDLVRRRLALRGRERVIADVREAEEELARGEAKPMSVEQIMREIQS